MREEDLAYFQEPDFLASLKKYEDAVSAGSSVYMDADELTDIAEYYMMHEQEENANKAIDLALSIHPKSVDPQIFLARQQMFHDNMKEAFRICDTIEDQEDREVIFLRSELMIRDEKAEQAKQYLKNVADSLQEEKAIFLYDCAGIFTDYALWNQAMEFANQIKEEFPKFRNLKSLLSEIHIATGRYKEAIPLLLEMLEEKPYQTDTWNLLAESQGAMEQYHEAIDSTEYVLAIEPDNKRALVTKANCLFHMNQTEEAHKLYQNYLSTNPQDDSILYLDAVCLASLEQFEEAAQSLQKANKASKEMSADQLNIYLQQAYVENKLHHPQEALAALVKAQKIVTEEVNIEFDLLYGEIMLENGFKEEAEIYFDAAIKKSKDKSNTLFCIGVAYGEAQNYEKAINVLQNIIKTCPGEKDQMILPYLAFFYFYMKDHRNFLFYLKRAAQENRDTTEFLFKKIFPNTQPEEYYLYAFRNFYGRFPKEEE